MKRLIILLALLILLISSQCFALTYYVTPTGLNGKQGGSPSQAMDTAAFVAATKSAVSAVADTWFFLAGNSTYTVAADIGGNLEDGTAFQPIMIAGITPFDTTSTSQEYPGWKGSLCSGASRPFLSLGIQNITVDNDWQFHGLMIEGTADSMLNGDNYLVVSGCSVFNVSPVANREAIDDSSGFVRVYNSEVSSTKGDAITGYHYSFIDHCYIHDSEDGFYATGTHLVTNTIFENIADIGVNQTYTTSKILQNTFSVCGTAIASDADDPFVVFRNNIFDSNTVAIDSEKDSYGRVIDYNNYWNNQTDIADGSGNAQKGDGATAYDPGFTFAAGATNYAPDATSGVTSAGKAMKVHYGDGSED